MAGSRSAPLWPPALPVQAGPSQKAGQPAPALDLAFSRRSAAFKSVVRAVGIEPTLLAELDFESSASTSFTTPAVNRMGDMQR